MEEKKKKSVVLKVALIAVCVLLVAGVGIFFYVQHVLGKIDRIDKAQEVQIPSEFARFLLSVDDEMEDCDPWTESIDDSIAWIESGPEVDTTFREPFLNNKNIHLVQDSNITNILLVGCDSRDTSMRGRSDSMIILSINRYTGALNLVSLLRDTYVEIPGYENNKINASYAFGGLSLLDRTIEHNFGIHIDHNVVINFDGFLNAFAKIGDIEITLTQAEADYLNEQSPYGDWRLTAGPNMLNSEQTLEYARIRYVGNSDWERTSRQRRVLMTAFNKCRASGLSSMLSLLNSVAPYVSTDMSNSQMVSLLTEVVNSGMNVSVMRGFPEAGMYQGVMIKGMSALVPDLGLISQTVHQILYGVD